MDFRPPFHADEYMDQFIDLLCYCLDAFKNMSSKILATLGAPKLCTINYYFMFATTEIGTMDGTVTGINRSDQQLLLNPEQENAPRNANNNGNNRAPEAAQQKDQQDSPDDGARVSITVSHNLPGHKSGGYVDNLDRIAISGRGVSYRGPRAQGVIANVRICSSPRANPIIHYEQDTCPALGYGLCMIAVFGLAYLMYRVFSK